MVKRIIKKVTTPQQRASLSRVINRCLTLKPSVTIKCGYRTIGRKQADVFCGYYDINPFFQNMLLYTSVNKKNECSIICEKDGKEITVATTKAWCWQQGCRLRWMPSDSNVAIWNDFNGESYCSVRYSFDTGKSEHLKAPLYDISSDGNFGISIDFNRLGYMRPGYGYTNRPFEASNNLENEAIEKYDFATNTTTPIIDYQAIIAAGKLNCDISKCYINHIKIAPDNKKFLFFFIEAQSRIHKASLFVWDFKGSCVYALETDLSVSHYCWLDNENVLVTAYDNQRKCKYYKYSFSNGGWMRSIFMDGILNEDGHPTAISDNLILTDTYPDSSGYQKIKVVDTITNKVDIVADIYSTSKYMGERRTDLHPRYDDKSKRICFDANPSGHRKVYVLDNVLA